MQIFFLYLLAPVSQSRSYRLSKARATSNVSMNTDTEKYACFIYLNIFYTAAYCVKCFFFISFEIGIVQ